MVCVYICRPKKHFERLSRKKTGTWNEMRTSWTALTGRQMQQLALFPDRYLSPGTSSPPGEKRLLNKIQSACCVIKKRSFLFPRWPLCQPAICSQSSAQFTVKVGASDTKSGSLNNISHLFFSRISQQSRLLSHS